MKYYGFANIVTADLANAITHISLYSHNSPGWTHGTNFEKLASILLHLLAAKLSGMSATICFSARSSRQRYSVKAANVC